MRSVATSFRAVAKSLEHHRGTVLSDSFSHHCWFFPPEDYLEPIVRNEKHLTTEKRGYTGTSYDCEVGGDCDKKSGQFIEDGLKFQVSSLPVDCREWVSSREGGDVSEGSGVCGGMTARDGKLRNNEHLKKRCVLEKTCGCGCVRLSDLPSTCEWIPLGDDELSLYVPDSIKDYLMRLTKESVERNGTQMEATETKPFPHVCDAFFPKFKAIEMVNDLASTLLRIAFSISEK